MFHDISLHLLDLAVNSVKAGADTVELALALARKILYISVTDNGRGISRQLRETLEYRQLSPGTTVPSGRGVMLFRDASRRTGGVFHVRSEPNCCTCVSASFCTDSPFFPLLGDLGETAALLVTGNKSLRVKFFVKNQISERDVSYGFDSDLLQGGVRFHAIGKYYWIREEINKGVMNIFGGVP